ncbi:hypothetical protein BJP34_28390 [Moorena producens PAL-8-15-08-1]|uniref:Uncharacterized protein n=2 Tax=Moorena TaxID=1155738 RepID=A0A1D8TYV8_9CYAN|nr:hypothetical protein BJP34_28390 [Moorena producens PAL-8-15-08-1]
MGGVGKKPKLTLQVQFGSMSQFAGCFGGWRLQVTKLQVASFVLNKQPWPIGHATRTTHQPWPIGHATRTTHQPTNLPFTEALWRTTFNNV